MAELFDLLRCFLCVCYQGAYTGNSANAVDRLLMLNVFKYVLKTLIVLIGHSTNTMLESLIWFALFGTHFLNNVFILGSYQPSVCDGRSPRYEILSSGICHIYSAFIK